MATLPNVIFEVEISTDGPLLRKVCESTYIHRLSEYMTVKDDNVYVGVRNWNFESGEKIKKIQFYCAHVLEKFDEAKLANEEATVSFRSMEELCTKLECLAYKNAGHLIPSIDLRQKNYYVMEKATISFEYKHKKFLLKKHPDLIIMMNSDLARFLGFFKPILESYTDSEKQGKSDNELITTCQKIIHLEKSFYVSDIDCHFVEEKNQTINLVVFDLFESYTVVKNGSRIPVLFTMNINDERQMKKNDIIATKKITTDVLKQIKFGIFNCLMEPISLCKSALNPESINFTLVFYK